MIKYLGILFRIGWYLILNYPKILWYNAFKNKINLDKRYAYALKLLNRVSKALKVEYVKEGFDKIVNNPSLFISNHQSFYDVFLMTQMPYPLKFISKKEVRKMPFVGHIAKFVETIFMDREDIRSAVKTIKEATNTIENNRCVWVFPEGTRTKKEDHTMNEFKPGVFKIAYNTKCDIVPIAICGTWKVINRKIKQKKFYVYLSVLESIPYEEYSKYTTLEISSIIHEKVNNKVNELLKLQ